MNYGCHRYYLVYESRCRWENTRIDLIKTSYLFPFTWRDTIFNANLFPREIVLISPYLRDLAYISLYVTRCLFPFTGTSIYLIITWFTVHNEKLLRYSFSYVNTSLSNLIQCCIMQWLTRIWNFVISYHILWIEKRNCVSKLTHLFKLNLSWFELATSVRSLLIMLVRQKNLFTATPW